MPRRRTRKSRPPCPSPARAAFIPALLGLIRAEYAEAVLVDLVVQSRGEMGGRSVLSLEPGWAQPVIDEQPDAVCG